MKIRFIEVRNANGHFNDTLSCTLSTNPDTSQSRMIHSRHWETVEASARLKISSESEENHGRSYIRSPYLNQNRKSEAPSMSLLKSQS
jgi:hypothetical protein